MPSTGNGIEISFSNNQTPIVQQVKKDDNIQLRSVNAQKALAISDTTLSLTISGQEYHSFENLKAEIANLQVFFRFLGFLQ